MHNYREGFSKVVILVAFLLHFYVVLEGLGVHIIFVNQSFSIVLSVVFIHIRELNAIPCLITVNITESFPGQFLYHNHYRSGTQSFSLSEIFFGIQEGVGSGSQAEMELRIESKHWFLGKVPT